MNLRDLAMEACLQLSKDALAIFDALDADAITIDTARSLVSMGRRADQIALALRTLVITGNGMRQAA